MTKLITTTELATLLESSIGSKFVSMDIETCPKNVLLGGRKKGEKLVDLFGFTPKDLIKYTNVVVGTGWDYGKAVTKRMVANGSLEQGEVFVPQKASGMSPKGDSKLIYQADRDESILYLRYYLVDGIKSTSRITALGQEIDPKDPKFAAFQPKPSDKPIDFTRCVTLTNIKRITIDKEVYRVVK